MATQTLTPFSAIPCCPQFDTKPVCDVIDMRRRLTFPTSVRTPAGQSIAVEVILHTRFKRCSGPFALGDLVYTTTLLPGETVRLSTTDRRSRFSFDSESSLSYRSEQLSEEQYRRASLRSFMSDQNSQDNGSSRSTDKGSWDFHGDASGSIGFLSASADANAKGSHNAESTFEYQRDTSLHTAGVIVKGCFDDCNICEPEVQKKMQLELIQLDLQNQLLQRQIDLLDKAQEYRCCPPAPVVEPMP